MSYSPPQSTDPEDDDGFVGSPTAFADADEVPEWVANVAKLLFFLPATIVTATTIPLIVGALVLVLCLFLFACGTLAGVY